MNWRPAVGAAIVLAGWYFVATVELIRPSLFPSPYVVAEAAIALIGEGEIASHAGATLARTVAAFLLAAVAGLIIGIPLGAWDTFYESWEFVLDFLRSLPAPALIPVAMLLLGIGESTRIGVAAFTCTLINAIQAVYGVRSISPDRIATARLLGADNWMLVRDVMAPSILPELVAGWRITISLSLIIVVVTEMFVGTQLGLGTEIMDLHLMFRIDDMYAFIVTVGLLGYGMNKGIQVAGARVVHWTTHR